MLIKNSYIFIFYRILFIILCLWGLYLNSGLGTGNFRWFIFSYYTILSNIVCLLYYCTSLIVNIKRISSGSGTVTFSPRLEGAVVFCITVTFLVYQFLLVPYQFSMVENYPVFSRSDILVHYVVPWMVIIGWIFFDKKGFFKWYDPLLWMIIPVIYFVFTIIRADLGDPLPVTGGRYPYYFLDADLHGWNYVWKKVGELAVILVSVGYFLYFMDVILAKLQKKRRIHIK
ncbi:MAG: Pr6Pr family membrane protein [Rikenellaceae bacterium]|nr:Pr6Pr family membrane protein [Rikenellaceae bacterium]